jgi:hypothetical protein
MWSENGVAPPARGDRVAVSWKIDDARVLDR